MPFRLPQRLPPFPPIGRHTIHPPHRLVGGQTPLNPAAIVIARGTGSTGGVQRERNPLRHRHGDRSPPRVGVEGAVSLHRSRSVLAVYLPSLRRARRRVNKGNPT